MKKFTLVITCIFAGLLLSSKVVVAQEKKVALVSFYTDKKISGPGMDVVGAQLINDPNFNLQPIIEKAYTTFITDFAKDFPFKLIDQSIVSNNPEYKNYKSKFLYDTTKGINKALGIQYAIVNGFVFGYAGGTSALKDDKRDEVNMYKILQKDCDGVMFVNIDYEITPGFGGLYAYMTAYLNMSLWDKDGKKIFTVREYAKSTQKVAAVGGIPVMKTDKILPLCQDATNVLFVEIKDKLGKIVKKSAQF